MDKSSFGDVEINKEVEGESEGGGDVKPHQEQNLIDNEKCKYSGTSDNGTPQQQKPL